MKNIFLVDADDTILDFHGASKNALRYAFEKGGAVWQEKFGDDFKRINDELWKKLEEKKLTRAELLEKRFPYYLSQVGMQELDATAFNERYLYHLATNPLYLDGAEEFLKELNKRGRVFIVTNGTYRIQKSRFDIAGLWQYAEKVFVSEKIGANKPAKAFTDYVKQNIDGFEEEKAVLIGDSLSADIQSANNMDVESIWFNPKATPKKGNATPTYESSSFLEILQILDTI